MTHWLADRAFVAYAVAAVVLCLNLMGLWMSSGLARNKIKTTLNEEDAAKLGMTLVAEESPAVARALRAHSNAQASTLPFLVLALVYVLIGANPTFAAWLFGIFTLARLAHSVVYLKGLQPWRSIFFGVGLLCMVVLMAAIAWRLWQGA